MFPGTRWERSISTRTSRSKPVKHVKETLENRGNGRIVVVMMLWADSHATSIYKTMLSMLIYVGFFGIRIVMIRLG
jgi:hypothetical protein